MIQLIPKSLHFQKVAKRIMLLCLKRLGEIHDFSPHKVFKYSLQFSEIS